MRSIALAHPSSFWLDRRPPTPPLEKQGSMRVYNSHLMDSLLKDEDEVSSRFRPARLTPLTRENP